MYRTTVAALLLAVTAPAQGETPPDRPKISVRVPLEDPGSRELRLYPVRDRLDAILDVQDGVDELAPEDRRQQSRALLRQLRDAIRTFVQPAFEDGEEAQALGLEHLAVVGRPEQHAWTEAFLARQAEQAGRIATVEVEVLRVPPATMPKLGLGAEPQVLDAAAAAAFRAALADAGVERLQSPRLSLLALQRAQTSALTHTSYVRDFEIIQLDDDTQIADPVVDVVRDGLTLDGWFVTLEEDRIGMTWSVVVMDLARPIPKFETRLGTGTPITIQLPDVAVARFDADVVLAPGALSVFPGPSLRGARVVLLMEVKEIQGGAGLPRRPGPALELIVPDEGRR